ncbi:MAG: family 43 glycosylhydrolase [Bacillota bacterium]
MARLNGPAALLSVALTLGMNLERAAAEPRGAVFSNPLYPGADPWIIQRDGWYYLCKSQSRSIEVWKSRSLVDRGERSFVWTAPRRAWNSAEIWAPELHYLQGRWYIYYAASSGSNETHRMGVLESKTDDPQGQYVDKGMLYTGDEVASQRNNRWAIDGTVMELQRQLYFLWSGWEDHRDIQHLYIARMENPWTISSNRVRLSPNDDYVWERVGEDQRQRGLHEGPAILKRNGRIFLVYSCSGSWEATYKLGMLYADEKCDPMDPRSWSKLAKPVFQSSREVFGVGHCSFVQSPDGQEDWIVYHAKTQRSSGWGRVVRAQKFTWRENGFPDFGAPVASGEAQPMPSNVIGGAAVPKSAAAMP